RARASAPIDDRLVYAAEENILFCNFEGLTLETAAEAAMVARSLNDKFKAIGKRVHVVVNYDNFDVARPAASTFFGIIRANERYVLSRTRYSTNAYFRRRLGQQFTTAALQHRLYH